MENVKSTPIVKLLSGLVHGNRDSDHRRSLLASWQEGPATGFKRNLDRRLFSPVHGEPVEPFDPLKLDPSTGSGARINGTRPLTPTRFRPNSHPDAALDNVAPHSMPGSGNPVSVIRNPVTLHHLPLPAAHPYYLTIEPPNSIPPPNPNDRPTNPENPIIPKITACPVPDTGSPRTLMRSLILTITYHPKPSRQNRPPTHHNS